MLDLSISVSWISNTSDSTSFILSFVSLVMSLTATSAEYMYFLFVHFHAKWSFHFHMHTTPVLHVSKTWLIILILTVLFFSILHTNITCIIWLLGLYPSTIISRLQALSKHFSNQMISDKSYILANAILTLNMLVVIFMLFFVLFDDTFILKSLLLHFPEKRRKGPVQNFQDIYGTYKFR